MYVARLMYVSAWMKARAPMYHVSRLRLFRCSLGSDVSISNASGGAYATLVRRQLAAGSSHAFSTDSLASLDPSNDTSNTLQPPSANQQPGNRNREDRSLRISHRGRSVSPDPQGRSSPRPPRMGQTKGSRPVDMTRQDTGAIVDSVMADVIGGDGMLPQRDRQPSSPGAPQSRPPNAL